MLSRLLPAPWSSDDSGKMIPRAERVGVVHPVSTFALQAWLVSHQAFNLNWRNMPRLWAFDKQAHAYVYQPAPR